MDTRISEETGNRPDAAVADAAGRSHPDRTHNRPLATRLPFAVPAIAVAGYGGILLAFWLTFAGDATAVFAIAISTVYAVVYFGVPYLMNRMAERHAGPNDRRPSLFDFLEGDLDTITGRISGWSALVQVTLIPVALAFGTLAIGLVNIWLR
jgi:hypothetical protein